MTNETGTASPAVSMRATYVPPGDAFDEMTDPSGGVRPHWLPFLNAIDRIGHEELDRNHQEMVRLLRENGIAYNIHGDPQGVHRKWTLDIIPFIFSRADWDALSDGINRRAKLLEMVLEDIYGPRHLIRDRLLPADFIYRHPAFLRPCAGVAGYAPHRLFMYSVDVARGPDGRLRAVNDHSSKPNGIGYTLENRTALAEVLPNIVRECGIWRLSNFFRIFQSEMASASTRLKEHPRIVILSPGPEDPFYFEHAYLAAYLGYPVVQGDDLTVRDGAAWLKSLDGLKRVDIIVRYTDDWDCDPLELSHTSSYGVAGLLEAARRKSVVMVNPPGTGVLENPALMAFLPRIAQTLMGEDLALPSVPTWWCGQKEGLDYVLANLDTLMIKTVYRSPESPPVYGSLLSKEEKSQWRERIRQAPHRFVGQTQMRFSTSPVLDGDELTPRHTACRLFSAALKDGGFTVLPGGIARGSTDRTAQLVSNRTGVLKDIWVISDSPGEHVSLWLKGRSEFTRTSVLPSRTAENLFWVGRYAERTEAVARMLRIALHLLSERDMSEDTLNRACLNHMVRGLSRITFGQPQDSPETGSFRPEAELSAIIQDIEDAGSLTSTLGSFLNAAYAVRDHWSTDTWRVINSIEKHRRIIRHYSSFLPRLLQNHLDELIRSLLAFTGLCMESMSREHGWLILDIGRRLERSLMFIEVIRTGLVPIHESPLDNAMMEAVLVTTENIITYRRRYRSYMELETTLDLLLMDDKNPRSLIYQLNRLQEHITDLPRDRDTYRLSEEERLILKAASSLRLSHTEDLSKPGRSGNYKRLDILLRAIRRLLEKTSEAVSRTYFSHIQESQLLGSSGSEV